VDDREERGEEAIPLRERIAADPNCRVRLVDGYSSVTDVLSPSRTAS
jgi:hypothetical protein